MRSGYKAMTSAPRDGTEIIVLARGEERRCWYVDCEWLRRRFEVRGRVIPGDPEVSDCWRCEDGDDIELSDAKGWRPVEKQ